MKLGLHINYIAFLNIQSFNRLKQKGLDENDVVMIMSVFHVLINRHKFQLSLVDLDTPSFRYTKISHTEQIIKILGNNITKAYPPFLRAKQMYLCLIKFESYCIALFKRQK